MLTLEFLKSILEYDPETGNWTYLVNRGRMGKVGTKAGTISHDGYWRLLVIGKQQLSHRLAFFYMTGEWPKDQIDHINGDKLDNRWCNLREATSSQNNRNKKVSSANTTGVKGVSKGKNGKFKAYLSLGTYDTIEEAKRVYDEAAKKLHGDFFKA